MAEIAETKPVGLRTAAGTGWATAAFGCLLALGALALALTTISASDRGIAVAADILGVGLPVGLGLFQISRRPDDRFARILIGVGILWSVTILAESSNATLYSVGRLAVWIVEPVLVYL